MLKSARQIFLNLLAIYAAEAVVRAIARRLRRKEA